MLLAALKNKSSALAVVVCLLAGLVGCPPRPTTAFHIDRLNSAIAFADLSVPTQPQISDEAPQLETAKNANCCFVMRLDCAQFPPHPRLRLSPFRSGLKTAAVSVSAYQVLSTPVDLDDAAYVRQTGQSGAVVTVPRILLPLPTFGDRTDLSVDLSAAHDPAHPSVARINPNGSILVWIDLHTGDQSPAGDFSAQCQLLDEKSTQPIADVPLHLTVENLALPDVTHLHIAAPLEWDALLRAYPELMQGMMPRLLDRSDPQASAVIARINSYLQLAHQNKADFYVPRLQPIVKWPLGKTPEADWTDFDAVVAPWMNGSAFADHQPIAFWPLPSPDALPGFDVSLQIQYWKQAADHFDHTGWLARCPVVLDPELPGRITEAESLLLCAQARQVLASHPAVTTLLPLHDDQLECQSDGDPHGISRQTTARLLTASPGLVYTSPICDWPAAALPPRHWIDAAARDGSCDITGIASEQGIRTLASLAFMRDASLILCRDPLPTSDGRPARANQLLWCYPGEAFGVDAPLATIQLKWLRQAEQDYEYLMLAAQHNDRAVAMRISRLLAKQVQLQPGQQNDPLYNLLAGTTEPRASEQVCRLLASRLTRGNGKEPSDTDPAQLQTLRWFADRQEPTLAPTAVQWMWNLNPGAAADAEHWIDAFVNVDLYNPSEEMPSGSSLEWTMTGEGWEDHPQPLDVPALAQWQVHQVTAHARFDLTRISESSRQPIQLNFVDGFSGQTVPCRLSLPVAVTERRRHPLNLDGDLDDWFPVDAIQLDQPMIRMTNRPALQAAELQPAEVPASVYTNWSDDEFFLAFRLNGVTASDLHYTRNFVRYDHGRAWGEDLCEVLIQPIYADNVLGPTLHVVCKPAGNWVERQSASSTGVQPWMDFEASGLRYASGVDAGKKVWRGELAIPWKAIAAEGRGRPVLLRFNFIQHQQSNAQSASWAGPIDDSRNGGLSGLLLLKE